MANNKKLTDLIGYTNVLPYASELFGIYQPLIGWKSKRISERFEKGLAADKRRLINKLRQFFVGQIDIRYDSDCQVRIAMRPGALKSGKKRNFNSIVMDEVAKKLPPYDEYDPAIWPTIINKESMGPIMKDIVLPAYTTLYSENCRQWSSTARPVSSDQQQMEWVSNQPKEGSGTSPARPVSSDQQQMETISTQLKEGSGTSHAKPVSSDQQQVEVTPAGSTILLDPEYIKKNFITGFEDQLTFESSMAGTLLFLADHQLYSQLADLFYKVTESSLQALELVKILSALQAQEAYLNIDTLDPQDKEDLKNVALSPISVVHLFRQYFFELDTFLGTPVSHVWLSPGATVELIEVHTLKTTEEKYYESQTTTTAKTESDTTTQDEISEAVKEENNQDVKFGMSVTASYMSVTATNKFDYGTSQKTAREQTHKQMREQTEKLSTEIRNNYKSTFKTVTETTDMSSKRYLLHNKTDKLLNYELRRKMRQVAVQVQDIGSYLCWQTYVDRPGDHLGVAELMHIAKPAKLEGLHAPDEIPHLEPFTEDAVVTVPFHSLDNTEAESEGEVYVRGVELENLEFVRVEERIKWQFKTPAVCSRSGYFLKDVIAGEQSQPVVASVDFDSINNFDSSADFVLNLDEVNFQGQDSVKVKLTYCWHPTKEANQDVDKQNAANFNEFKAKEIAEYKKAFVETAKERIKLSHGIKPRPSEDLREEERIVVYRKLVKDLIPGNRKGTPDDRTLHIFSELINSIFDIDKMLYFVAPDWWRPQDHSYSQHLGAANLETKDPPEATHGGNSFSIAARGTKIKTSLHESKISDSRLLTPDLMGWGGINSEGRDNYMITEDSEPATFGSSLGWLLQLDGDNMRNAFLNAPWVKAVIPIRPMKEAAAINWLKGVEGFDGIGNTAIYRTDNPNEKDINGLPLNGQKMIDVIMDLAKKIQKKYEEGLKTGKYPRQDEISDPALVDEENTVTATPIDRVYEHGFFPLEGGFRANIGDNYEIFDQWIEILPTDQIVPVEVKYDPKTGRQI